MKQKYKAPWGRWNHNSHCNNIIEFTQREQNTGKAYDTAKIHKLSELETADQLPLRPIVLNIGTEPYYFAKHLVKILAPSSKSKYTVQNAKNFVNFIQPKKILSNHQLISFEVA